MDNVETAQNENRGTDMKWKKSELIAIGLFGIVAVVALIAIVRIFCEYAIGKATYTGLEQYVFLPEEQDGAAPAKGEQADSSYAEQKEQDNTSEMESSTGEQVVYYGESPQVNFAALRDKNSDVIAWIYGPGTVINYPVVQGTDNEFYLTHMFDGRENKCGSIFMDSLNESDFSNANSVLHGHHMKNGTMFASLMKYESQSYFDSHPVFWLTTPEKSYRVEIFSGFVTSTDSEVWQLSFATEEEHQKWLDKMVANSAFESEIKPSVDDHILTLSTCSYEYDDARFVVLGILR